MTFLYSMPKDIPSEVYHIWQFIDNHPECKNMDEEDMQEMANMWYRKAAINRALKYGKPTDFDSFAMSYPLEQDCVSSTYEILLQQKIYSLDQIFEINIQELQNNVPGLCF